MADLSSNTAVDVAALLLPWQGLMTAFVVVLLRVSGWLAVGPLLGRSLLPWQARVGLAVTLSLALTPVVAGSLNLSLDAARWIALAINEFACGFLLGCGSLVILWAIPLAGHLLDQQHGTPSDDADESFSGSPQTRWLTLWGATCFLLCSPINGHVQLVKVLADSFREQPVTRLSDSWNFDVVAGLLQHASELSLLVLAPGLATLCLVNLTLGLVGATSSANVGGSVGSAVRPAVSLLVLLASLSGMSQFVADAVRDGMTRLSLQAITANVDESTASVEESL